MGTSASLGTAERAGSRPLSAGPRGCAWANRALFSLLTVCAAGCGPARHATGAPHPTPPQAALAPAETPSPTPAPGVLYVDVTKTLGPISPLVFGTNFGPWQSLTPSMMPFVEGAGFTFLRFPGGNWGDEYLLTRARFDEFIELARRLKAEPMVNVRLFRSTPAEAAQWVRYANVERGLGIRYWGIGNEPSLYESKRGAEGYDAAAFNQAWRAFAQAMKAVDPSILLVGPEIHQYTGQTGSNPVDRNGVDWMRSFLLANGDLVDVVSFHRYPFGASDPSLEDLRGNSREWDLILPGLRALIRETTGRELPIAVTEVNSNWSNRWGGEATPDSAFNAVWWADVLGRMISQHVGVVAHFALEGAGGLGLMGHPTPRPTYYVFPLMKQFGSELLYASSGDPLVGAYAALREDGALTILIVNLGPHAVSMRLQLQGLDAPSPTQVWLLDEDHLAEKTGEQMLASGDEITLPAQSASLYVLRGA